MIAWHSQELPTSCVSACVRMVLQGLSLPLAERQVRQMLGHTVFGLSLKKAHANLTAAGALAHLYNDWNADDLRDALRQKLYPIVGVERHVLGYPPASHAIVLLEIKSRTVNILDPFAGPQAQAHTLTAFELAWHLAGPEALIIESPPQNL